jgi:hypothetical protein
MMNAKLAVTALLLVAANFAHAQVTEIVTTNTNNNNNVSTSTSTNTNNNNDTINQTVNSTSTSTNTNINTNNDTINQTINSTSNSNVNQTSNSTINQTVNSTNTNTNNNNNVNSSTATNTNINQNDSTVRQINSGETTQNIKSPPASAIAPAIMSNNNDLCTTGISGAVQTQILGIAGGSTVRDMNCERLKLSKTLYDMGMKVAAVSVMCQDERIFKAMEMAGTPCPFLGEIGPKAAAGWAAAPALRPDFVEWKDNQDYLKNVQDAIKNGEDPTKVKHAKDGMLKKIDPGFWSGIGLGVLLLILF